jgi:hypothetical protein
MHFDEDENDEPHDTDDTRDNHCRCEPSKQRRFDQGIDHAGQTDGRQHGAPYVDLARAGMAALRHAPLAYRDQRDAEWQVDEECPVPGHVLDEEPADDRARGRRDATERRPCADGGTTRLLRVGRTDQREAAGDQHRGTEALHRAGDDEPVDAGRCRAR